MIDQIKLIYYYLYEFYYYCGCARVCAGMCVCGYARVCVCMHSGVQCGRVCIGVHKCALVCAGVCKSVWMSASVCVG